jgi:hypothetical protein
VDEVEAIAELKSDAVHEGQRMEVSLSGEDPCSVTVLASSAFGVRQVRLPLRMERRSDRMCATLSGLTGDPDCSLLHGAVYALRLRSAR